MSGKNARGRRRAVSGQAELHDPERWLGELARLTSSFSGWSRGRFLTLLALYRARSGDAPGARADMRRARQILAPYRDPEIRLPYLLQRAETLYLLEDEKAARRELERFQRAIRPGFESTAEMKLSGLHLRRGDARAAVRSVSRDGLVHLLPHLVKAFGVEAGRRAVRPLRKWPWWLRELLPRTLARAGDPDGALALAKEIGPIDMGDLVEIAKAALRLGRRGECRRHLAKARRAFLADPENYGMRSGASLGAVAIELGRDRMLEGVVLRTVLGDESPSERCYALRELLVSAGLAGSTKDYRKLVAAVRGQLRELHPRDRWGRSYCAMYVAQGQLLAGDLPGALETATKIIIRDLRLMFQASVVEYHLERDEFEQALKATRKLAVSRRLPRPRYPRLQATAQEGYLSEVARKAAMAGELRWAARLATRVRGATRRAEVLTGALDGLLEAGSQARTKN